MSLKDLVIQTHDPDQTIRVGLVVTEGPIWLGVIWPDSDGMSIVKVAVANKHRVIEYNLAKAKRMLRGCGKRFGITKSAKRALKK